MDTDVRVETHRGVPVLHVTGELDVHGVPELRQHLIGLLELGEQSAVVIDLTDVTFIDCTGLGVLVGARERMLRQGGSLSLVVQHEGVLRTLRISAIARMFDIFGDVDSALSFALEEERADRPYLGR